MAIYLSFVSIDLINILQIPFHNLFRLAILLISTQAVEQPLVTFSGKLILNSKDNSSLNHNEMSSSERSEIYRNVDLYLVGNELSLKAFPKSDGSFVFHKVPPGPYLLNIHSIHYQFGPVRVDVSLKDLGVVRMKYAIDNSIIKNGLIRPETIANHFEVPQSGFSIIYGLLSNPIILIMGGMMLVMTVLQKVEPESLKEINKEVSGSDKKKQGKDFMPHMLG